jgi:hypothetical protein
MDDIQAGNEPKSTAAVRDSHPHPFVEHKPYRTEAVDSCAEVVSIRMARAENIDLVACSP